MTTLRQAVLEIVEEHGAIKGTDLALKMADQHRDLMDGPAKLDAYMAELEAMVKDNELIEVEYTTPQVSYRTKSIYMPKGTILRIPGIWEPVEEQT